MKIALIAILLALVSGAGAFSELIPNENFPFPWYEGLWIDCTGLKQIGAFQPGSFTDAKVMEKIVQAQAKLQDAKQGADFQENPLFRTNPAAHSVTGYFCSFHATEALRRSLEATRIIAVLIDKELETLDFEIGDDFTGTGSLELIEAKEATQGKGEFGSVIYQLQSNFADSLNELKVGKAGKIGQSVVEVIKQNGTAETEQLFLNRLQQRQLELKTLEETLELEVSLRANEVEELTSQLKEEEVEKLGWFELKQLELSAKNEYVVDATVSTTPGGLYQESETQLEEAKALKRQAAGFKTRGRAARRIENFNRALERIHLSELAAEESLKRALELLSELQEKAVKEQQNAEGIDKPLAKIMVKKIITDFKLGGSYFEQIQNLNRFIKQLRELQLVYSGKVTDDDRLRLKIDVRDLQRIANAAEKQGVTGAGEIAKALRNIYNLADEVTDSIEFAGLQEEKTENANLLFALIDEKFGYLRDLYTKVNELEKQAAFTPIEKEELAELRETFVGNGQISERIDEIPRIENSLKTLIATGLKRTNSTLASLSNSTANRGVPESVPNKISSGAKNESNFEKDFSDLLAEFQEISNEGTKAFYSEEKTKKSLEELKFDNALKEAQRKAKELQKTPTVEKASELKKHIEEMNTAIQEVQRKASVEIAIAEERGSPEASDAAKRWTEGKYTQALQAAQKANKKASETSPVTAQVAKSDDPKMWAVAGSLVIILIGAAYLFYVKKNGEPV